MYPFAQSITPAVRTAIDAPTAFVNEMSTSMFRSFQQICELNIKLAQTMLDTTRTARAVVDDLARISAEETERGIRTQQEALRTMTDPFARANGAIHASGDGAALAMQQASQQAAQQAAQASQQARPSGPAH